MLSPIASMVLISAAASAVLALPSGTMHVARQDVTVTDSDLTNFELFSQYSAAAYCNYEGSGLLSCSGDACPIVEAANATAVTEFDDELTSMAGFVALDPTNELIVVSFRGSNTLRNWLLDVLFVAAACDLGDGCYAHAGFLAAWESVKSATYAGVEAALAEQPTYPIVVTGHSLGAAVATLAGATLRDDGYPCDIYTFGSPRVGNNVLATYVSEQTGGEYRVTHLDDPVPRLPPILFGYRHTTPEYWLSDGNATTADYTVSDIVVCTGTANTDCNAGEGGFDTTAHSYYLGPIAGCAADTLEFRDTTNLTELYANQILFGQLDIAYAAALDADGNVPSS